MKRLLLINQVELKPTDKIEVEYQEGFHGHTEPQLGPVKKGILSVTFYREHPKKPVHIYPQGVDIISIDGSILGEISLRDGSNNGDDVHFSVEEYYVILKKTNLVFKD